ncbi:hypothetical protein C3L29_004395 [Pseudomonas sp. MWU12-2534b]|nr:hypothetical protein C3L29_004395 [Pseudomonas sp. MWU12-2534b]
MSQGLRVTEHAGQETLEKPNVPSLPLVAKIEEVTSDMETSTISGFSQALRWDSVLLDSLVSCSAIFLLL